MIDPQGRDLYLPRLVQDFSTAQDVFGITIVDFEGYIIHSSLISPPNYRDTIDLRSTLAVGESTINMFSRQKNIVLAVPIDYYHTPQGAVIAEFKFPDIVSRAMPLEEFLFYKLYFNESVLLSQNFEEGESYISLYRDSEEEFPYLNSLGLGIEIGAPRARHLIPVRNTIFQLLLIGVVFIVVAVLIAAKIGNSIAKPILQLCERVKKVTTAEAEKCSPLGTEDELEELARVFDSRTEQLIQSQEHLANNIAQLKQEAAERKRAEESLRASEDRLLQAQKMEAIGRLAGGIAHDFNNLLTIIIGYSDLLLSQQSSGDSIEENVKQIKNSAERATSLTQQLLAFSRKQIFQTEVVNLNRLIESIQNMLKRLIGENIDLSTRLDSDLGRIRADPGQIEQIIMNLVVNARDAMPNGGKLTIETRNVYLAEREDLQHPETIAGNYALLAIHDTGHGIDKNVKAHIFEPFYTTKELGKGTGLGLSTVYGIVKQSGGSIDVHSELNKGTIFEIYLPVIDETDEKRNGAFINGETRGGSESIFVVEDEEILRKMTCTILKKLGYTTFEAESGSSAIDIFEKKGTGGIDLLITDVIMPEMSGRELSEKLLLENPGLKVLFMSGYADDAIMHHGVLEEGVAFLQKPFSPKHLARQVREVLDKE
ncbi:Sensor histidine kinase RcsC [subsurface metagenome]